MSSFLILKYILNSEPYYRCLTVLYNIIHNTLRRRFECRTDAIRCHQITAVDECRLQAICMRIVVYNNIIE